MSFIVNVTYENQTFHGSTGYSRGHQLQYRAL